MTCTCTSRKKPKNKDMHNIFDDTQISTTLRKPFLKWAGGKFRLLPELKKHFPTDAKRFVEPFLGAGSVALNVDYPTIIVNDTLTPLFQVWQALAKSGPKFIQETQKLFTPENNTKDKYYQFREEFNSTKDKTRRATLFVYLNRHCFNGLCRFNKKGLFNSPVGSYKSVYFPTQEFTEAIPQIKRFDIHNKDFRDILKLAQDGDVVYCDPPYVPWSTSANFATYSEDGFSYKDQHELAQAAFDAATRGATVVVSNHFTPVTQKLYVETFDAEPHVIDVQRYISSKTDSRESVKEIIAVFKPR